MDLTIRLQEWRLKLFETLKCFPTEMKADMTKTIPCIDKHIYSQKHDNLFQLSFVVCRKLRKISVIENFKM